MLHALTRSMLAMDRASARPFGWKAAALAFDKSNSVRTVDTDGRMHVEITNISKAAVNPYLGREIPDHEALGLDPDKIYKLLRDPEELAKAAPTFNRLPLLSEHIPVSADDHQPDLVLGATGSHAVFESPFLKNSLVLWAKRGIDAVESESHKELSSAYRYRADMTPGVFEGTAYDGVMRDIVGNHVALVKEGRAGPDVVVGDSKLKLEIDMSVLTRKAVFTAGALGMYLTPKLATDAKLDLQALLKDVTDKNFKAKSKGIAEGIVAQTKGKLAKDESIPIAELNELLDKLGGVEVTEGQDIDPSSGLPLLKKKDDDDEKRSAVDADPIAKIKSFLEGILTPEQLAEVERLIGAEAEGEEPVVETKVNGDDPPPFKGMPKKGGEGEIKDVVKKDKAMDAKGVSKIVADAVKVAQDQVIKSHREIRDAEREVRPWVGEIQVAMDSAEAVKRAALKMLGVAGHDTLHKDALSAVLAVQPKPNAGDREEDTFAMDASDADKLPTFEKMFPDAVKVGFGG